MNTQGTYSGSRFDDEWKKIWDKASRQATVHLAPRSFSRWALRGLAAGAICAFFFLVGQVSLHTTFASIPTANVGGRWWCSTDSWLCAQDGGAAAGWTYFGPVRQFTQPPDISTWTQDSHIGTSSVTQAYGGIQIIPQVSASRVWRMIYKSQPSTPYTITARMAFSGLTTSDAGCALGFMDNAGKTEMMELILGSGLNVQRFNADTTFNANVFTSSYAWSRLMAHLRIKNDSAAETVYGSNDGSNWTMLATWAVGTFITPTRYVFGTYDSNTTPSGVSNPMTACTLMSLEFQ